MEHLRHIFQKSGIETTSIRLITGGDINDAFCATTPTGTRYFIKTNRADSFPQMFQKEELGLEALENSNTLFVPRVYDCGLSGSLQYLILEWLENGHPARNFWEDFGTQLALMHQVQQPYFGWEQDNYIGSLPQKNVKYTRWDEFYAACRVLPLVKLLFDRGHLDNGDVLRAQNFCKKLNELFATEPPSLLHGDLWSGNFMAKETGFAAVFDPAVYFGHREMDIGMTLLFGGFDNKFYEAYQQTHPMEKGWQHRVNYTQLYPLLVHSLLFGGHYITRVRSLFIKF